MTNSFEVEFTIRITTQNNGSSYSEKQNTNDGFNDMLMSSIFGNHESKRISMWIKRLVTDPNNKNDHDEYIEDNQIPQFNVNNEESKIINNEYKVSEFFKKNSQIKIESKELISHFYLHLMSVNKEIVILLNNWYNTWIEIKEDYKSNDQQIQRDNITRRIPEHLDEEDKKKFELIRQVSAFKDEEFYRQYIELTSIDLMRRESSDKSPVKTKLPSQFDQNMFVGMIIFTKFWLISINLYILLHY